MKTFHAYRRFCVQAIIGIVWLSSLPAAASWISIDGAVKADGQSVCALVLANGQSMFSCGKNLGRYALTVPTDDNGQVTIQAFAAGFTPFRKTTTPSASASVDIDMARASSDSRTLSVTSAVSAGSTDSSVNVSGTIQSDDTPVCALVLANGQRMFSCGEDLGQYSLDVPLDENRQIAPLYVFAAGFTPFDRTISVVYTGAPDTDDDGDGVNEYQGDCDDDDASVYPGAPDTCADTIDQDCDGADATCATDNAERLAEAWTWMYQIQDLNEAGAVTALADSDYPLLVIEPGHNFSDWAYDTAAIVSALARTPDDEPRLLLAYIDIGQAEDYRDYWGDDWMAPTDTDRGSPDFLVTVDPDGWSGNYPVAYWQQAWKSIWLGSQGIIATLARFGFDGVYLDWVEAYDDDAVIAAADQDGVDPAIEMIRFIEEIGAAGRTEDPAFLVVPQNAPYLIDYAPLRYAAAIDALAVEDTWYHGDGDADWDDPRAGDLHERHDDEWSTANRLLQYQAYQSRNLPVFSVDYCISTANAAQVYSQARAAGLRPLVTRVSLSRMTVTPPADFP